MRQFFTKQEMLVKRIWLPLLGIAIVFSYIKIDMVTSEHIRVEEKTWLPIQFGKSVNRVIDMAEYF